MAVINGNFTDHRGWTDLTPGGSKFLPPNVIITAEDLALHGESQADSHLYSAGRPRIVEYYDAANDRRFVMELYFYVHPAATADLTLSTTANRFITGAGALAGADATVDAIAGCCFSHYYTNTADFTNTGVSFQATTLTSGDGMWVVRRGRMAVDYAGAVTANLGLKTAANGEVTNVTAGWGSPGAIEENVSSPLGEFVGICREDPGGVGIGDTELHLPRRYTRF